MGSLENPLPEVDQEEHPLRVLSQENMTVVSTFTGNLTNWIIFIESAPFELALTYWITFFVTDSMSVANDLDRIFPRSRWYLNHNSSQQKYSSIRDNIKLNGKGKQCCFFLVFKIVLTRMRRDEALMSIIFVIFNQYVSNLAFFLNLKFIIASSKVTSASV